MNSICCRARQYKPKQKSKKEMEAEKCRKTYVIVFVVGNLVSKSSDFAGDITSFIK